MILGLPEHLDSTRFYLQRLRYEFAEEIFFAYASKPEATAYVAWPTHRSVEDTRSYLNYAVSAWSRGTDYSYVLRLHGSNRLIGSIGCMNDEGKVQFGYILNPNFWNQGYATEAAKALVSALCPLSNVYRIWTFIDADNISSAKVLLKCGLVEEARVSKWFRFVNQNNQPKDCVLFKLPDHFLASNLVSQ
jgi:[ribosomal protein S5]-alanine N-acetyltransferase